MDRSPRRPAAALGVAVAVVLGRLALAADGDPPIRALHWIAPGADPLRAIGVQPTECLQIPADAAEALQVEVGRAAFRTPLLLGGQAARAGLACETCHRNGRSNPDFQFPGVSGAAGTADVTQSLFSSHRGDGIDNPRPIPDLSGPKTGLKVDQSPDSPALEGFIRGLVVEEFDGDPPPPAVLQGLAAYVRALQPSACPATAHEPVDVRRLMSDARRALAAARAEIALRDRPAAILMLAAARARLALIDERLDADRFAGLRARLRAASGRLAEAQGRLRQGQDPPDADFVRWLAEARPLEADLVAAQPATLFNPIRLQAAANRPLPH
ncbi:hypothetical protein LJR225_002836 [Phenylobacterium sp. LjRoot225]|uniref:hypothetical protein n=1 Tax=Phenylobacterium sp. LjRoot225 TaxID=3342285 RepID=UPI003ECCAD55